MVQGPEILSSTLLHFKRFWTGLHSPRRIDQFKCWCAFKMTWKSSFSFFRIWQKQSLKGIGTRPASETSGCSANLEQVSCFRGQFDKPSGTCVMFSCCATKAAMLPRCPLPQGLCTLWGETSAFDDDSPQQTDSQQEPSFSAASRSMVADVLEMSAWQSSVIACNKG